MKHVVMKAFRLVTSQPPSGGCVLKLGKSRRIKHFYKPAAFRRLCVETVRYVA